MDLDAFVSANEPLWRELDVLTRNPRLSASQAERIVDLYQRTSTHLSILRSQSPDPTLIMALSSLLARARRRTGRAHTSSIRSFTSFFTERFPATLYRLRWWWLTTMVVSYLVATVFAVWTYFHPELHDLIGVPEAVERLVNHDFESYYSEYAASHFALYVWTNNAWVSALCVALGITGIGTVAVLFSNVANLGIMAALMIYHGRAGLFFGLITPHGLLELTCVFVAGGAGLALFWSWVVPGNRTRADALAFQGRTTMNIVIGLVFVLAICGIIEAFVTPSALPTAARVSIGVAAWLAFMWYALVVGRKANRRGITGDIEAWRRSEEVISVS